MRSAALLSGLAILFSTAAVAQPAAGTPTFEVASIKPTPPPQMSGGGNQFRMVMRGVQGGPGTSDPGQITANGVSVKSLLMSSYDLKSYQIIGPDTLDADRYDIVAKVAPGASKDDVKVMWQNLLAERFKVTFHRDSKDLPMYALVIAKNGPKMKETPEDPTPAKDASGPAADPADLQKAREQALQAMTSGKITMKDGVPQLPPGMMGGKPRNMMMSMNGRMVMTSTAQTMTQLADMLSNQMDRPVVDQTGLTKKYDYTLSFAPNPNSKMSGEMAMARTMMAGAMAGPGGDGGGEKPADADAAPPLPAALQEQLGLKLEAKKNPVATLVVDHAERVPTEN